MNTGQPYKVIYLLAIRENSSRQCIFSVRKPLSDIGNKVQTAMFNSVSQENHIENSGSGLNFQNEDAS